MVSVAPLASRPASHDASPRWLADRRAARSAYAPLLVWGAVVVLVLAALAWRLHGFMVVPRLTDESDDVLIGLRIARGEVLPLTAFQPYIGALYNYVVAGAFLVLGPQIEAGRVVVAVAGALTIVPTFLLGRRLGGAGRRGTVVGLAAAGLLATSATHTVVSSRIAYSHSLTPLAVTTGLWLLHRALARQSGPSLVLSGLAFGLALQTHSSALAFWLGPGVAALLGGRGLLTARGWRWTGLAGLAALLAVANLIVFNLLSGFESVAKAGRVSSRYVAEGEAGGLDWLGRLLVLLRSSALALGSGVSEQVEPWGLASPLVIVTVALVLVGLWSFARRREWLPLLAIAGGLLAISYLNGRVEPVVPRARHYAPLLPLGLVAAAEGIAVLRDLLRRRLGRPPVADVAAVLVVVGLAGGSLVMLKLYEAERLTRPEKNNAAYLAVLDAVASSGRPDERVYLDGRLVGVLTMSGGRMLTHLRYAFEVVGQEWDTIDVERDPLPLGRSTTVSRRLILNAETVPLAEVRYRLVPLPGEPGPEAPLRAFRAYPRPAP